MQGWIYMMLNRPSLRHYARAITSRDGVTGTVALCGAEAPNTPAGERPQTGDWLQWQPGASWCYGTCKVCERIGGK